MGISVIFGLLAIEAHAGDTPVSIALMASSAVMIPWTGIFVIAVCGCAAVLVATIFSYHRIEHVRTQTEILQTLLRTLPDLVLTVDERGQSFEILSDPETDAPTSSNNFPRPRFPEAIPPEQLENILAAVRRAQTDRSVQILEYAVPSGSDETYYRVALTPLSPKHGKTRRALVQIRITTAEKRALRTAETLSQQLRETTQAHRTCQNTLDVFFENIPDPAWMKDANGRYSVVNSALARICGYPKEYFIGKTPSELHLANVRELEAQEAEVRRTGNRLRFESCLTFQEGECRWVEVVRTPVRDADGKTIRSVGIARDITSSKRNEVALVQTQERFRALVEKASDCFMVVDRDKRITYIGPSVSNVTGRQPEHLVGKRFDSHVHPDDQEKVNHAYVQVATHVTDHQTVACRVRHQDDSWHFVEAVVSDLEDNPAVRGIVINLRDTTERHLLERQFQQAQKMETMGQLAGGVAHDFNNCLQSIEGLTDLLLQDFAHSPQEKDLQAIKQAAHQAASVTRQLLVFSRRQTFDPRVLDLNAVVRDQQKMLTRLIGENVHLDFRAHTSLWKIRADVGQLQQIIMNLILNACDAMPSGGNIRIRTDNVSYAESDILPGYDMCAGRFVQLSVSDTGIGMTPEIISHIFEPFFTTKAQEKGTGLGLSVVHGIVKQHEGWIHVYSTPGNGSEFKVYLPAGPQDAPERNSRRDTAMPRGNGQRILLVEDDLPARLVTNRNLTRQGYVVEETTTVADAYALFQKRNCGFALLLSDVVLPDGNGVELTKQLLHLKPELKIILTSGYADDKARWHEIADHGWAFLQKPYPFEKLFQLIDQGFTASSPGSKPAANAFCGRPRPSITNKELIV
jgi:PAS domain S-box-containing protein